MTEAELLSAVRELAGWKGWLTYHTHNSRRSEPGFPDLVLVKPPRLIFAELKSDKGRIREEQKQWLQALGDSGMECHVWRPRDLDRIEKTLSG